MFRQRCAARRATRMPDLVAALDAGHAAGRGRPRRRRGAGLPGPYAGLGRPGRRLRERPPSRPAPRQPAGAPPRRSPGWRRRWRPCGPRAARSWPPPAPSRRRQPRRAGGRDQGAAGGEGRPAASRAGRRRGAGVRRGRAGHSGGRCRGAGRARRCARPGCGAGGRVGTRGRAPCDPGGPQPGGQPGCGCCWTPSSTRPPGCAASWRCRRSARPAGRLGGRGRARRRGRGGSSAALLADDPAVLDELLSPAAGARHRRRLQRDQDRLPDLPLEQQRTRLRHRPVDLAARSGAEVTCCFDGATRGGTGARRCPRAACGCCSASRGRSPTS